PAGAVGRARRACLTRRSRHAGRSWYEGRFRRLGVEVGRVCPAHASAPRRAGRPRGLPVLGSLLPPGLRGIGPLDQRGRDVLGLALVAVGVFMGFVLWGGWDGGRAGHGLAVAFGWTLGRARVLAPLALVGAGGTLLLGELLPSGRPLPRDPRTI